MDSGRHRRGSRSRAGRVVLAVVALAAAAGVVPLVVVLLSGDGTQPAAGPTPSASGTNGPTPGRSSPAASPSTPATTSPPPSPSPSAGPTDAVPRPAVVQDPIPLPQSRKDEMRSYAVRHYGLDTYRLVDPKVIVEHFTAGSSYRSAWNTFASNHPDLGELPGTCAHFIVDTDGTIYQLAPLNFMCRHTTGLNWTAFGIEMVGTSDAQILGNPAQRAAVEELTLWLMDRFHIQLRNVIGHNESLTSPYRHELDPDWRCQTHADWNRADMDVLRADLARMAKQAGVPIGPPATPVTPDC